MFLLDRNRANSIPCRPEAHPCPEVASDRSHERSTCARGFILHRNGVPTIQQRLRQSKAGAVLRQSDHFIWNGRFGSTWSSTTTLRALIRGYRTRPRGRKRHRARANSSHSPCSAASTTATAAPPPGSRGNRSPLPGAPGAPDSARSLRARRPQQLRKSALLPPCSRPPHLLRWGLDLRSEHPDGITGEDRTSVHGEPVPGRRPGHIRYLRKSSKLYP
jgi:hypothetical protein